MTHAHHIDGDIIDANSGRYTVQQAKQLATVTSLAAQYWAI